MNVYSLATELFADRNTTTIEKILVPCGSHRDAGREGSVVIRVSDT
jgi:hypothetical protein